MIPHLLLYEIPGRKEVIYDRQDIGIKCTEFK